MKQKINKKPLIDLFESMLEYSTCGRDYQENNEYLYIEFDSSLSALYSKKQEEKDDINYNSYWKSNAKTGYSDCKMKLFIENDKFYLGFNSVKANITFSEFKRLKNKVLKSLELSKEKHELRMQKMDNKLLNVVLFNKTDKEKRVVLLEKKINKSFRNLNKKERNEEEVKVSESAYNVFYGDEVEKKFNG